MDLRGVQGFGMLLFAPVLFLLAGIAYSIALQSRQREWRFGILLPVLGALVVREIVTLMAQGGFGAIWISRYQVQLVDLLAGITGLLSVVLLARVIQENKAREEQLRQERKTEAVGRLAEETSHLSERTGV